MHGKTLLLLGSVALLTACGGGDGTNSNATYDALVATGQTHSDKLDTLTPTDILPTNSATFTGVAVLADDFDSSTQGAIGEANLSVNFGTQTVTGSADTFFQTDIDTSGNAVPGTSAPVAGSLAFAGSGFAPGSGAQFNLDVDGTVNFAGADQTIDGTASGAFFGPNADMLVGFGTDMPVTAGSITNADIAIIAD